MRAHNECLKSQSKLNKTKVIQKVCVEINKRLIRNAQALTIFDFEQRASALFSGHGHFSITIGCTQEKKASFHPRQKVTTCSDIGIFICRGIIYSGSSRLTGPHLDRGNEHI